MLVIRRVSTGGGGMELGILSALYKVFAGMVILLCLPTHTTGAAEHAQSCLVVYVGSGVLNEGPHVYASSALTH